MVQNLLDPVIIFFLMGVVACLLRVSLSIHQVIYETISVYLLLALGLKGGYELTQIRGGIFGMPLLGALVVGVTIPILAFFLSSKFKRFSREDAVALAAHYGAASAVTFAVVLNYLEDLGFAHENFFTLFLVVIEVLGIFTAFSFLHLKRSQMGSALKNIIHDVLLNKSIFLMLIGIVIGWVSSVNGFQHVKIVFIDLFKGVLCFFMLEMGLVCGLQIQKIRKNAGFILGFGLAMPLLAATLATFIGWGVGLSVEGTAILSTIAASASYIAAPVVSRSILPHANLAIPLICTLGVTFPFNVLFGIPLYHSLARSVHGLLG